MLAPANRRFLLVIISLVVLLVTALIAWRVLSPTKPAPVKMGYLPMISSLTYFVALDQGYFVEEGVNVTGIPIQNSNGIATALGTGEIDIGVELSIVPLLAQFTVAATPSPFIIFSASHITAANGFDSVLVRVDSPLKNLSDLSAKKVAVFPGTTASRTLLRIFQTDYPTLQPPTPLPMAPNLHLGALDKREVDAIHAYEPYLSVGLAQHGFRRLHTSLYAHQLTPNPIGVAAVNRAWHTKNKTAAQRAIRALDRAAELIEAYQDKAQMIAIKYTGVDADVARIMNIMPMSTSSDIPIAQLDRYIAILKDMGEINTVPEAQAICLPGSK